ncbi:Lrp/AsnC family transcriptional regulator [Catenulispora pinisilvae]|uniref:Lrp/AsnC family transcriptional regulator n=1 Tax=Catenulispora pinisilvae TaxID=2705253 RepID=UPI001890EEA4|nr:Lrp/AsnC family transcriptional regulator [Catenulispora pinisilvae]
MSQDLVDELDLELVHALQLNPRASWSTLGRALDIDPVTVARRWERLEKAGLAWTFCVPGPIARTGLLRMMYVEIECAPNGLSPAIDHLLAQPHVIYLHHMTGARSLLAAIAVADLPAASAYSRRELDALPGARAHHPELLVTTFSEASRWRLGTLEPARQHELRGTGAPMAETLRALDDTDEDLIRALTTDARRSHTELAAHVGVSDATVRRRLARLLADGRIRMRCEIAQSVSGWPVTAVLRCHVPAAQLATVARAAAHLPETRLAAGMTGAENLLLIVWLRDAADLPEWEAALATRYPELVVTRRGVCLRTLKHMGRLFDERGAAVDSAPIDIWQPDWQPDRTAA